LVSPELVITSEIDRDNRSYPNPNQLDKHGDLPSFTKRGRGAHWVATWVGGGGGEADRRRGSSTAVAASRACNSSTTTYPTANSRPHDRAPDRGSCRHGVDHRVPWFTTVGSLFAGMTRPLRSQIISRAWERQKLVIPTRTRRRLEVMRRHVRISAAPARAWAGVAPHSPQGLQCCARGWGEVGPTGGGDGSLEITDIGSHCVNYAARPLGDCR